MNTPQWHYVTSEEKERAELLKLQDLRYDALEANDMPRVDCIDARIENERHRLDAKYANPGTAWYEKQEFVHSATHVETIPAGRYVTAERRGLALRATARYEEALGKK